MNANGRGWFERMVVAGATALAACGPGPRPEMPAPETSPEAPRPAATCVVAGEVVPGSTVRVAVSAGVSASRAPRPTNDAERLVFRQLYETPVRVDCEGNVLPGLAESWMSDASGRVWTFRIRDGATFWDGSPVFAADVGASWAGGAGRQGVSGVARIEAVSDRVIAVELREPAGAEHFADPSFAVARYGAGTTWPMGTGPYRVLAGEPGSLRLTPVDAPVTVMAAGAPALPGTSARPVLELVAGFDDAVSALDAGADVVVARDSAALAYARALDGYRTAPLQWSRTYALLVPAPLGPGGRRVVAPPVEARSSLARDAVRADVRPAEPAAWWDADPCSTGTPSQSATPPRISSVGYAAGDDIARGIAERLVALAGQRQGAPAWLAEWLPPSALIGSPAAVALGPDELEQALRSPATALVVPLSRRRGVGCALPDLDRGDGQTEPLGAAWRIAPLLDARDHIVHRRAGGFEIDGDGAFRFVGGLRAP